MSEFELLQLSFELASSRLYRFACGGGQLQLTEPPELHVAVDVVHEAVDITGSGSGSGSGSGVPTRVAVIRSR